MDQKRILVSGGGIAGLTFAVELKRRGFDPLVIEREPALRQEGYMMDFFGTGWDVAERMELIQRLRAIRYPIDALEFVDAKGKPYLHMPIERVRHALNDKYVYLRRQDLERILAERAREVGITLRYGCSLAALKDNDEHVHATFESGEEADFALVVGADGVHSRVRELLFGPEQQFARFLGLYVAAFHLPRTIFRIGRAAAIHEEANRMAIFYALDEMRADATYCFRHAETCVPKAERLEFLRAQMHGASWILEDAVRAHAGDEPLFFDSATQIVMPHWHRGRVALIGDACGCLTLLAGQGSHMAMAGGYVLAQELARHSDHTAGFAAYQDFMKPHIDKKQRDAARLARLFVPSKRSHPWLRRLVIRLMFSRALINLGLSAFGVKSILRGRP